MKLTFQGYGKTGIAPVALAYYWYEWALQDIGEYGEQVYLIPGLGEESQAKALRRFQGLVKPGDTVEGAFAAEHALR